MPSDPHYLASAAVTEDLRDILQREWPSLTCRIADWATRDLQHLYLVGCGGSLAIFEPIKWLLDRYSTLPVDCFTGWEFVMRAPRRLDHQAAVLLASHSGSTEEITEALTVAKAHHAVYATLSARDSPLSAISAFALSYHSRAVNLSKLLLAYMAAAELLHATGYVEAGDRLRTLITSVPALIDRLRRETEGLGQELALRFRAARGFYVVASGPLTGLAYQFAACNLMEMQWLHGAALHAGEFRHGPLEIVESGLPMVFLLGTDDSRPVTERALAFALRHGANAVAIDLKTWPEIDPCLAPFALYVPLQWFCWHLGIERSHPMSQRRYMGKVPY